MIDFLAHWRLRSLSLGSSNEGRSTGKPRPNHLCKIGIWLGDNLSRQSAAARLLDDHGVICVHVGINVEFVLHIGSLDRSHAQFLRDGLAFNDLDHILGFASHGDDDMERRGQKSVYQLILQGRDFTPRIERVGVLAAPSRRFLGNDVNQF